MIDLTDPQTLSTIQAALRRALNSLDNEIEPHRRAVDDYTKSGRFKMTKANLRIHDQHTAKLLILTASRDRTRAILDALDCK